MPSKDQKITVTLTRKQTAPRNVAAKALRDGPFKPKVEEDPKAYKRKKKHKQDPVLEAKEREGDAE
jgi:hypothetical protein